MIRARERINPPKHTLGHGISFRLGKQLTQPKTDAMKKKRAAYRKLLFFFHYVSPFICPELLLWLMQANFQP
jgi:hypothetical protein